MSDVTIIGAGIVGLSCGFYLQEAGLSVTIIDKDPEGDKCSFGNAAGLAIPECTPAGLPGDYLKIPKWLLDPLGPLFVKPSHSVSLMPWLIRFLKSTRLEAVKSISSSTAALNMRAMDDYAPLLKAIAYENHVHHVGAIVLYGSEASRDADQQMWDIRAENGVLYEKLDRNQITDLEPSIAPSKTAGILQKQWAHIDDPKDLVDRLRRCVIERGGVLTKANVKALSTASTSAPIQIETHQGETFTVPKLVIAAGAWSKELANMLSDPCLLESERGYNTTLPTPGIEVNREIIFAEEKFVATPTALGLRIGGGAEFAGLDAAPNYQRCNALLTLAQRHLDGLNVADGTQWMGHRPTTPDSLPVISKSCHADTVFYAFGHGHLGLTQGATTGKLISGMVTQAASSVSLEPYSIQRFS